MAATLNQWIAGVLLALGAITFAIGVFFAVFTWMNDGLAAALRTVLITTAFGAGLAGAGVLFRLAAAAHVRGDSRRWGIQILVLVAAWFVVGLAAFLTSLVDRLK